jgi:hypothetical protein
MVTTGASGQLFEIAITHIFCFSASRACALCGLSKSFGVVSAHESLHKKCSIYISILFLTVGYGVLHKTALLDRVKGAS